MCLNKTKKRVFKWHCNANRCAIALFFFFNINCGLIPRLQARTSDSDIQETEYKYENKIYSTNIKSVEVRKANNYPTYPTIQLNGVEFLTIEFDDISEDEKSYYYKVIHCDRNWNPTDLETNEYLNGFNELWIDDVENSFSTAVQFTHYEFNFPNSDMIPTISGNYLMVIYEEDMPSSPIITSRIIVYEQLVNYSHKVKPASVVKDQNYRQELDFNLLHPNYEISRPYEDIHQVMLQNFNWHTSITDLKPMFVKNNELTYDYGEENTFSGLNEYRSISFSSLNSINSQVLQVNINASDLVPELIIRPSETRRFKLYTTYSDINGDFKVDSFIGSDDDVEAEYCRVYFSIPVDDKLPEGKEVFLFGGLSFNSFLPQFKLKFNETRMVYEATILLKQGFYNYIYTVKDGEEIDTAYFEGEHFQTLNDFHVITYDSNSNIGYDRVIGVLQTSTF